MNADNDPPIIAERLAIESLEDYLERYGLPPPNINDDDGRNGEFNGLNRTEAQERMQAEKAYLDAFIEKHHSNNNSSEQAPLKTGFTPRDDCQANGVISVLLANKKRHDVPIQPVYQYCDTVRRMTVHRSRFGVANDNHDGNDDSSDNARDLKNNCKSLESDYGDDDTLLELSLEDFDVDATLQFMSALQSLHEHQLLQQQKQPVADNTKQHDSSTQIDQNVQQHIDESSSCTEHIIHLIDTQTISSNSIIEVLKLSHFLQCNIILDTLVSIVESSIDLENCLSICSLADALNLSSLFESSVHFVIRRLDALQGSSGDYAEGEVGEEEGESKTAVISPDEDSIEELWKSLPYDLRSRVLTMRNILRSSIIGRGSKMSGVFFSSGNEFLAIFRETISVQKERLTEARERLEEVVRERKEEFDVKRQRRGRWFDSSADAEEKFVYGGDVAYSMRQIDRQAKRLATLESFYQEQKMIFGRGGGGVEECKLSFSSG
eukprot:CAMPEP_0201685976 /NCGR_PEP_ID=MMETSP0578-20130828/588_1 /ASSEMBLY_ACC=CAM_ASM_000663 /TAXON_ID=267565 /ORGANISM="Skeletonema grethea, Strain CCMP 1804" /LENGTH=491 /DNA_ID=CAMNT_0048169963 /DNA_START=167 /DNA_END=1642 /DNA_ORIENTATION=+